MKPVITFIFAFIFPLSLFAKDTAEFVFWKWFDKNQSRFEYFERDKDVLISELSEKISAYQNGLVFEIGVKKDGVREFVISADGVKDLFPAVSKLVASAPKLTKWQITAFRPRMEDYSRFILKFDGRDFNPKEMWFYSRIKDGNFDVIVYHPSYRSEDRDHVFNGTYILLDMALGEYDVVTGIHNLDHQLLPANPKSEGLRPFSELRSVFDEFKKYNKR